MKQAIQAPHDLGEARDRLAEPAEFEAERDVPSTIYGPLAKEVGADEEIGSEYFIG